MSDNNDSPNFPLSQLERRARSHAILSAIGFLILLPVGVLVARYSRTLRYKWFWAHSTIQLVVSAPVILLGWALGYKTAMEFEGGHYNDPHKKVGLVLLVLYILQILLGVLVHYVKLPSLFRGYRPPHSYIHILLGLCILALAQWQVHYGLFTEWLFATGGLHRVPESAKHAWLALVVIFWVSYALGMAFIPRQFKQESLLRNGRKEEVHTISSNPIA